MLSKKTKYGIKAFIFFLVSTISFSQEIVLKYIGEKKESIPFVCQGVPALNTPTGLNNDNRTLKIKIQSPTVIKCLNFNKQTPIFALPNETIEFDINEKGLINYSSKINKYRQSESQFVNDCFEKYGIAENILDYNELKQIRLLNKMTKYFDSAYLKEQELLEIYYKSDKISKEFYDYFKVMYWSLIKFNELEKTDINPETFSLIEKSFRDGDELIAVDEYRSLLGSYVSTSLKKDGIQNNLYNNVEFIVNRFENQKIKDYLLFTNIDYALNSRESKTVVDLPSIALFRKHCKNQGYLDAIDLDLQPQKTPFVLQNMINKYAGKLVLVDFWASWCKPCREEFPNEKKLMEEYPNVAFIFISIDKSSSAWEKALAQYPDILNKDNSFLLTKSDEDQLLKDLDIRTIPRYVLFGKNGAIIHKDAPRPSSLEIGTLLRNHL
jgi:thiol-disulfide isomerase/thioredoxin